MVTYYIGPEAVALGLDEEECGRASGLVRQRLALEGLEPWESMESELFSLSGGYLLISRPCPPRRERLRHSAPRLRRL